MTAYYNENDPFAAAWLRQLIKRGLIPDGEVDERSIVDVCGDELRGFLQCHFFAGIGGWPCAGRLAGLPDDFEWWTGSCPCQSLSVAGKRQGHADERHLWPAFYRLIAELRPAVVAGEQVASADGREWFSGVRADLEDAGYACGAAIMPAAAVGAPHRRERLFWVADADGGKQGGREQRLAPKDGSHSWAASDKKQPKGPMAHAESLRLGRRANDEDGGRRQQPLTDRGAGGMGDSRQLREGRAAGCGEAQGGRTSGDASGPSSYGFWSGAVWFTGADGKTRRVGRQIRRVFDGFPSSLDQSGNGRREEEEEIDGENGDGRLLWEPIPLLTVGQANRVGLLRGLGNAIVPQLAAAFLTAVTAAIEGG